MKGPGVITIFLSLTLLLFLNFLMTTIEAARITAGRAYLELLGINAGRCLEGRYYYPLFEEYGLLAMDPGEGIIITRNSRVKKIMKDSLDYAESNTAGGLINISDTAISAFKPKNLVSEDYKYLKKQIREEALYEGAEALCDFFTGDALETVGNATALQLKQQEVGEAAGVVCVEILRLMELVDGVCTTDSGLKTDKKGNYQVAENFGKKFNPCDEETLEASYGNLLMYELVKEGIFMVRPAVNSLLQVIKDYSKLGDCDDKDNTKRVLEVMYETLYLAWNKGMEAYGEAIKQAEILARVQRIAQSDVLKYEQELLSATGMDKGILSGFFDELDSLKDYVGLTEKGYNAGLIKNSLLNNYNVLQSAALRELGEYKDAEQEIRTEELVNDLTNFLATLSGVTYDHLQFDYGNLKASDDLKNKLTGTITKLFAGSVFALLGVEDVSEKEIDGAALPSKGNETSQSSDIMELFKEISGNLAGGQWGSLFKAGYQGVTDDFLMEVYLHNHFDDFTEYHDGHGKIDYEREYLLFGKKDDEGNLLATVTRMIAIRAAFCFAAVMTDAARNQEATALAQTMAVFGVPALVYAAKYLILTVWAIEEAVVEVAALLAGKKVAVFNSKGNIMLHELLLMSPEMVKAKVSALKDTITGIDYSAYITVLSFMQPDSEKYGRTLDLIQENIRYRYRSSFRIGDSIVAATYTTSGKIEKRFSQGFFTDKAYEINVDGSFSY